MNINYHASHVDRVAVYSICQIKQVSSFNIKIIGGELILMMAPIYIHPRVKKSHLKIKIHESSFKMCIYAWIMDYVYVKHWNPAYQIINSSM